MIIAASGGSRTITGSFDAGVVSGDRSLSTRPCDLLEEFKTRTSEQQPLQMRKVGA
uniref:Uncharacterized protein n=1 Tax=Hyaloperonospora arabidopsidis (strain Emoy2) TaxID=559515 RepID=M4BV11_HYAAE